MEKKIGKAARELMENVIINVYIRSIKELSANDKTFQSNVPGFLISPQKVIFHWFDHHVAISFEGDALKKNPTTEAKPEFVHRALFSDDRKTYVFSAASGLNLDKADENELTVGISLALISGEISRRGFLFSGSSFTSLIDLGWRIEEFNTTGLIFGFKDYAIPNGKAYNFQNIFIFHELNSSSVSVHHIKWLDVIPYDLTFHENGEIDKIFASRSTLQEAAITAGAKKFFIPTSYEQIKFNKINRFVELWGNSSMKETTISRFLGEDSNKFLLTMHFGAKDIYPELSCSKDESSTEIIRPDFFIEKASGVCDIVELKLPRINRPIIVGRNNRRRFASWFDTHLAQAKAYQRFFSNPEHRLEVYNRHGITVDKPTVTLVIGRRFDVNTPEVRELMSEYQGINIISYDELVDGVVAQLYL